MSKVNDITRAQFNWIFENVYKGPGLDGKSGTQREGARLKESSFL